LESLEICPESGSRATSFSSNPQTAILIATYNGGPFLGEQLCSLEAQSEADWILVARDDLSTDATSIILDQFAARSRPRRLVRLVSGPARLGALGNFLTLLKHAPPAHSYAFCDQDDVWLPEKLSRAVHALASEPEDLPVLYCARQQIVDGALRELCLSPDLNRRPSLQNALVQNIATGCTIVMNEAARRAVLAAQPPSGTLHDWWSYLVVTAVGGHVVFDPHPVILYRQHGANAVGAVPSMVTRAAKAARRGPNTFMQVFMAHVEALLRHPDLTAEARSLLERLVRLPEAGLAGKLGHIVRAGLYRQGTLEQAALYAWVVWWHLKGGSRSNRS